MSEQESRIYQLLHYAITDANVFSPNEKLSDDLVQVCFELYSRDNDCIIFSNAKGLLCSTYPGKLIIPIKQKNAEIADSSNDHNCVVDKEFQELVTKGRFARTRGRFPIPVLLFGGKLVCRSSTLARSPEIYTRTGFQYFMQGEAASQIENNDKKKPSTLSDPSNGFDENDSKNNLHHTNGSCHKTDPLHATNGITGQVDSNKLMTIQNSVHVNGNSQNKEWLLDKMRNTDIDILHTLKVNVICDLMVENKKVKYGLNVTSSEKVDRQNRYSDFHLLSIPYPGCEFFADYSNNNYVGVGLKFDWKQNFVDAELQIPEEIGNLYKVCWKEYMQWDLVTLTQNYIKLLLRCLALPDSTGILLHCISGWDRTPLFISLLRLSLWADGLIHQSLNAEEIVYFTLAYDWLLFCHQFSDRIYKSEEIMHFCFEFLKDISTEEYSLLPLLEKNNDTSSDNLVMDDFISIDGVHQGSAASNGWYCSTNRHTTNNETDFEEIFGHGECDKLNCLQMKTLGNQDEALVNLQDVETCVDCLVNNVSCTQSGDGCLNGNSYIHSRKKKDHRCENPCSDATKACNDMHNSAAILPLPVTENVTPHSLTPQHSSSQASATDLKLNQQGSRQTIASLDCTLAFKYETGKDEVIRSRTGNSKTAMTEMPNSSNANADFKPVDNCSSTTKSEPIPVPSKSVNGTPTNRPYFSGSISSSISNPALAAEPGGSWQMISTSPPELLCTTDANFTASSAARLSQSSSYNSPQNCCNCISDLNLKLEKRREKLKMARNIMIPEYSAVVQKQKQQQEQSGFSALVGTLVHLVKRV